MARLIVRLPTIHHGHSTDREPDYLMAVPNCDPKATIILVHGWPDLSIGWRNQIPLLLNMGYQVICPDIMGFGGTVNHGFLNRTNHIH